MSIHSRQGLPSANVRIRVFFSISEYKHGRLLDTSQAVAMSNASPVSFFCSRTTVRVVSDDRPDAQEQGHCNIRQDLDDSQIRRLVVAVACLA
jgi:hypothetical protein